MILTLLYPFTQFLAHGAYLMSWPKAVSPHSHDLVPPFSYSIHGPVLKSWAQICLMQCAVCRQPLWPYGHVSGVQVTISLHPSPCLHVTFPGSVTVLSPLRGWVGSCLCALRIGIRELARLDVIDNVITLNANLYPVPDGFSLRRK